MNVEQGVVFNLVFYHTNNDVYIGIDIQGEGNITSMLRNVNP